ncbi:MAG TPA: protein phosphatase 2C domain-containing protein [Terriglobales bacterium]|jgi:protein phosphatase|nr:protein phosphatase 2C domain-containing protein [Terriglobales bacterium]
MTTEVQFKVLIEEIIFLTRKSGGLSLGYNGPMLDVEFAELSDTGLVREHNEDCIGHFAPATTESVRTHGWLFAIADGVGGQAMGELASRAAVDSVLSSFRSAPQGESHSELLPRLVQQANKLVYEAGRTASSKVAPMATTFVACALRFDLAVVAHVGDSRCYLIRRGRVKALTLDHTVAAEQERLGLLPPNEAATAPTRYVLSRALGTDPHVKVEVNEIEVYEGDILMLCSDGLHGAVTTEEIAMVIKDQKTDLKSAAHTLVEMARTGDGSDNISIQLIRVRSVERMGMYRGRPYRVR